MTYDICNKCQRFFVRNGSEYCDECSQSLTQSYKDIEKFLEENPHSSIIDIVNSTGASLKDVNLFIDNGGITCEKKVDSDNFVNLREEEVNKEMQIFHSRESLKIKNKFTPRRLRK